MGLRFYQLIHHSLHPYAWHIADAQPETSSQLLSTWEKGVILGFGWTWHLECDRMWMVVPSQTPTTAS